MSRQSGHSYEFSLEAYMNSFIAVLLHLILRQSNTVRTCLSTVICESSITSLSPSTVTSAWPFLPERIPERLSIRR